MLLLFFSRVLPQKVATEPDYELRRTEVQIPGKHSLCQPASSSLNKLRSIIQTETFLIYTLFCSSYFHWWLWPWRCWCWARSSCWCCCWTSSGSVSSVAPAGRLSPGRSCSNTTISQSQSWAESSQARPGQINAHLALRFPSCCNARSAMDNLEI